MSKLIPTTTITTINSYKTVFVPISGVGTKVAVHIKENNNKKITYQVYGSFDGVVYESIIPEKTINELGSDYEVLIDPWKMLAIQVKSTVVDQAGKATINVIRG